MITKDFIHRIYLETYGELNPMLYNTLRCPVSKLSDYQKSLLRGTLNFNSKKRTLLEAIDKFLQKDSNHLRVLESGCGNVEGFILFTEKKGVISNLSVFIDKEKPATNLLVSAYLKPFLCESSFISANWRTSVFHPFKDAFKEICTIFGGGYEENEEFISFTAYSPWSNNFGDGNEYKGKLQ